MVATFYARSFMHYIVETHDMLAVCNIVSEQPALEEDAH